MGQISDKQRELLGLVVNAILDTVKETGPKGTPSGPMFAALLAHGGSLKQYEDIMGALVRKGKLRQDGDLYFIVGG